MKQLIILIFSFSTYTTLSAQCTNCVNTDHSFVEFEFEDSFEEILHMHGSNEAIYKLPGDIHGNLVAIRLRGGLFITLELENGGTRTFTGAQDGSIYSGPYDEVYEVDLELSEDPRNMTIRRISGQGILYGGSNYTSERKYIGLGPKSTGFLYQSFRVGPGIRLQAHGDFFMSNKPSFNGAKSEATVAVHSTTSVPSTSTPPNRRPNMPTTIRRR